MPHFIPKAEAYLQRNVSDGFQTADYFCFLFLGDLTLKSSKIHKKQMINDAIGLCVCVSAT